jgi:hypothetical protein
MAVTTKAVADTGNFNAGVTPRAWLRVRDTLCFLCTATCGVVHVTKMKGSGSDDCIYYHLGYKFLQLVQRSRCFYTL